MDDTFQDGHDELYHRAKFGGDRTTRADCRCENVVFVFLFVCLSRSESGAPCVRGVHSSNTHCVAVFRPISTQVCSVFSEVIALSDTLHSSHIRRQVAPQFSLNCGQKLRKVQKSAEKFVRTTSYRQLRDQKKILTQQFRAEYEYVVQKQLGMNKFVRTKSHTGSKFSKI